MISSFHNNLNNIKNENNIIVMVMVMIMVMVIVICLNDNINNHVNILMSIPCVHLHVLLYLCPIIILCFKPLIIIRHCNYR